MYFSITGVLYLYVEHGPGWWYDQTRRCWSGWSGRDWFAKYVHIDSQKNVKHLGVNLRASFRADTITQQTKSLIARMHTHTHTHNKHTDLNFLWQLFDTEQGIKTWTWYLVCLMWHRQLFTCRRGSQLATWVQQQVIQWVSSIKHDPLNFILSSQQPVTWFYFFYHRNSI